MDDLSWQLPRLISDAELNSPALEGLRDGLVELLSDGLRWQSEWPHVICDRPHLSGPLAATCVRGIEGSRADDWLKASVLALRLHADEPSDSEVHKALRERLSNLASEENARLFWAEDTLVQSLHTIGDPWRRFAEVTLHDGPVVLRAERDLGWIKDGLGDTARSADDRAVLLEAAMLLSPNPKKRQQHVSGLKPLVADEPSLMAAIDERLKPSKDRKKHERWEKKQAKRKRQEERRRAKDKAKWIEFFREVAERPETAFSSERSWNTAWNLTRTTPRDGEYSREPGWNRRFIEEHFGKETADRLRRILMNIWREDRPILPSERPANERRTYLTRWQLGLAALYAEAEDSSWATKLTQDEARLAARYAPIELGGLPLWMESLVNAHPEAVDAIIGNELSWELKREPGAEGHSPLLQDVNYASEPVARLFLPRLQQWLEDDGGVVDGTSDLVCASEQLRQVIGTVLKHGDEDMRAYARAIARQRLQENLPAQLILVWLPTLMRVDPELGVSVLEERIRTVEPAKLSEAIRCFAVLFGDRHDQIDLKVPAFTPQLLLRLLRLAYRHVRPEDDALHEGVYSPDTRDHAERARNAIVTALLDAKGEEGWAAKLEMANDPLCAHFKDRIIAVAEEHWAREIDSDSFNETQAVALDKTGEASPSTNEAMFALMNDRLAEVDDLLLSDTSPREAWAGIADEKVMRREIARELNHLARGVYKVDQEAVTADEKETDIRLRSVVSEHEAVIELKRADRRTARDLRDTIHGQLVRKYMAAETSRSGCLLVTLAKDRQWKHPDQARYIRLPELLSLLQEKARTKE